MRKSASGLLAGMRQVQDLDLDVARALLHVTSVRRRLAQAKHELCEQELKVVNLSKRRERLVRIQSSLQVLREVASMKRECDAVTTPLSEAIDKTIKTSNQLSSNYPQET